MYSLLSYMLTCRRCFSSACESHLEASVVQEAIIIAVSAMSRSELTSQCGLGLEGGVYVARRVISLRYGQRLGGNPSHGNPFGM